MPHVGVWLLQRLRKLTKAGSKVDDRLKWMIVGGECAIEIKIWAFRFRWISALDSRTICGTGNKA